MTTQVVTVPNLHTPDFEIGTRVPNKITLNGNIIVAVAEDATAKTVTYTKADGTTQVISMAAFDIHVDDTTSAYDATANVLTLKQKNGGPDVVINLDDLQKSAISNGIATVMSGDGTDASPLKVDVVVDPASDPSLTASAAGVKLDVAALLPVEVVDAFGVAIGHMGE